MSVSNVDKPIIAAEVADVAREAILLSLSVIEKRQFFNHVLKKIFFTK